MLESQQEAPLPKPQGEPPAPKALDRATLTKLLVYTGIVSLVVGGGVGGVVGEVMLTRLDKAVKAEGVKINEISNWLQQIGIYAAGDTPVVLIGDSVKLRGKTSGGHAVLWNVEATGHKTQGDGPIKSVIIENQHIPIPTAGQDIVLMMNIEPCGLTPRTAKVWQHNSDHVIHVEPPQGEHFSLNNAQEIEYKSGVATCPNHGKLDKFSSVSVKVGNAQPVTYDCTDSLGVRNGNCTVSLKE